MPETFGRTRLMNSSADTSRRQADTSQLWCACHNGLYDLGGNNVSGPPPRPLESFTVNLRGEPGQEDVVISKA